jgi:dCMP deaminase
MDNRPTWSEYFMLAAKLVSIRSTCNSRKVGAVIVRDNRILATGYNGAVHGAPHCTDRGVDFCLRRFIGAHDSDKYNYCIASHAEVNAIDQAARFGISLSGSTLYTTLEPCNWCFKQLIQAGIREIYYEEPYDSGNKEFDLYWRKIVRAQDFNFVLERVSITTQSLGIAFETLRGSSTRKISPTDSEQSTGICLELLSNVLDNKI